MKINWQKRTRIVSLSLFLYCQKRRSPEQPAAYILIKLVKFELLVQRTRTRSDVTNVVIPSPSDFGIRIGNIPSDLGEDYRTLAWPSDLQKEHLKIRINSYCYLIRISKGYLWRHKTCVFLYLSYCLAKDTNFFNRFMSVAVTHNKIHIMTLSCDITWIISIFCVRRLQTYFPL